MTELALIHSSKRNWDRRLTPSHGSLYVFSSSLQLNIFCRGWHTTAELLSITTKYKIEFWGRREKVWRGGRYGESRGCVCVCVFVVNRQQPETHFSMSWMYTQSKKSQKVKKIKTKWKHPA